ncbi:MAG: hypothetical protein ACTS5F_01015 [Candidatus Hodgkinia cicadicola]
MFPFEHLTSVISNMSPSAAVKSLFSRTSGFATNVAYQLFYQVFQWLSIRHIIGVQH